MKTMPMNRFSWKILTKNNFETKIKWGPSAVRLTKDNFKTLKKNQLIYMDRDSVHFRGPIVFHQLLRGPKLKISAKDRGYDNIYFFILNVDNIDKFQLYMVPNSIKKASKTRKKYKGKKKVKKKQKSRKKVEKVKKKHIISK